MHPILLTIGQFNIYSYGMFMGIAFFLAGYLFIKKAEVYGYVKNNLENLIFYIFLSGILGARLLYVILNWNYYSQNFILIFKIYLKKEAHLFKKSQNF